MALIEVTTDWQPSPHLDSAEWGDSVGVFEKIRAGRRASWRRMLVGPLMRSGLRLIDRAAVIEGHRPGHSPG
jgi:hypothetical protein